MARENQGLQIALIILVILTIGLMVATFFGWKGWQEDFIKANEAVAAKSDADSSLKIAQTEINALKKMIGFADTDPLDVVTAEKDKDMQEFAGTLQKENQKYRQVVRYLKNQLDTVGVARTDEVAKVQTLMTRNEGLEKAKEQQILAATKRADDAEAERQRELAAHKANRAQLQTDNKNLQDQKVAIQEAGDAKVDAAQQELAAANGRLTLMKRLVDNRNKQLDDILKPTFEVADGKVQWVNQRAGTVWINLGQSDSLGRQTSFSVYASDTSDVTDAGPKASIEVTRIHGAHLAECRIMNDEIADPIMPGDLIHTPVWAPGQRQHFAIADGIDIDDDLKSDLQLIRNVITMNGGVVDFYLTDAGESHGEMTTETRYLVLGKEPGINDAERLRAHSDTISRAGELGIRPMPVLELLARMGWKNQSPVVKYVGGKASDFAPKPHKGVPPVSSGNVSPLFQERKPPRSSGKSAFGTGNAGSK